MRHHILVPTDFSDNAWSAALYALKIYADEPCKFYFSHTWTFLNSGSRTYISPSYIEPLKDKAREQLAALKERAESESTNKDHEFETIFSEGELFESVEFSVKKYKIDLVVMGTKGATGAKKFLLGSNAVTVIQKVRLCPLMLVPNKYKFATPKHIAFSTDFNRIYGEELLPIKQLSDLHDATIEILHIQGKDSLTDAQNLNLTKLKTNLGDYNYNFNWMEGYDKKAPAITDYIEQNNIDILTMINYEHSFIENLIKEPIIKKIGFHSKIPFMVIPGKH